MDDRFVPLATYLRAIATATATVSSAPTTSGDRAADRGASVSPHVQSPNVASAIVDFAHADVVHELTMLRLEAMEAFERRSRRLIADLAHDVLARELALAPIDIEALVARAVATLADHEPIALAIASADLERVHTPLPVRSDPTLVAGDLVVYVRDGSFESPFAFRLADALERGAERGVR